jgi:hypothetical protein
MSLTGINEGSHGQPVDIEVQQDATAINISRFTTLIVYLHRCIDGEMKPKTAAFKTDGTDGVLTFTPIAGDLTAGNWILQVYLANETEVLISAPLTFPVDKYYGS